MHNPCIGQRGQNQRQVQIVHRQLVDESGGLAPHARARLQVHIANGAGIRLGGSLKELCRETAPVNMLGDTSRRETKLLQFTG